MTDFFPSRSVPALFPVFLKLTARNCLVVGAGKTAEPKIEGLINAGARVFVVAPKATVSVQQWSKEGRLLWDQRPFELSDLDGASLVIVSTASSAINLMVLEEAQRRHIFCAILNDPVHGDFSVPAVVRRGALQIAISTADTSPALAHRLRQELESQFGPEYETWLQRLAEARSALTASSLSPRRRRGLLRKLASHRAFQEFVGRGELSLQDKQG